LASEDQGADPIGNESGLNTSWEFRKANKTRAASGGASVSSGGADVTGKLETWNRELETAERL
jgi:hypothetical protein